MTGRDILRVAGALAFATTLSLASSASGQGRTDVVSLANGDRITGEVVRLERGQLEFKTDDAGTLYLEWEKLMSVVASRLVEVITSDDRRFLGTLGRAADRSIAVVSGQATVSFQMTEVTFISPIGTNFWRKLDGSIDAGFSYTRSSGIAQLNLNSDTVYRRPAFTGRLTASLTQTQQEDGTDVDDDRASIDASYLSYRWQGWVVAAAASFEMNESLGLELRSQGGASVHGSSTATARSSTSAPAWQSTTSAAWMSSPPRTWRRCSCSGRRTTRTIDRRPIWTSASSTFPA